MDGLPFIGSVFTYQDSIYCYYDQNEEKYKIGRYEAHAEDAIVESVRIFETTTHLTHAALQFRISRPVNIGDKVQNLDLVY